MASKINASWYIGEDKVITDTISAGGSISGWTLRARLSRGPGQPSIIEKTTGSGIEITSASGGIIEITFTAANTSSLEPGAYYLDVWRTNSGYATQLSVGWITLLEMNEAVP